MTMMPVNGVELCVETFGDAGDPPILLIMGAAASMLNWDERFCRMLADGGRFVIRYDHRDTGQSTSYPPGEPGYGLRDLLNDAVGLLQAHRLASAHVVGMSMGGGIGQLIAIEQPQRVRTLTLIATTPGGPGPQYPDLPPPSDDFMAIVTTAETPDWSDREAAIDYVADAELACASRNRPLDRAEYRANAARVIDRSWDIAASMTNHFTMEGIDAWRDRLPEISAPTLVIQGEDDPVFSLAHGEALAAEIPGARLLPVPRMGHEVPENAWPTIVPAILAHTAGA